MVLTSKSFSVERDFEEVAKTNDEIYLLDFASVKAAGSNGEIKYIVLISFLGLILVLVINLQGQQGIPF